MARLSITALVASMVFLPLGSYALLGEPGMFWYRAATRWASMERPIAGNPLAVFAQNVVRALLMFNWDDGEIFAISVPNRPALDVVSGALLVLGVTSALWRVFRHRCFFSLALLVSIPLLQLPSTLSLAFPNENPAPNRAGATAVPVFLLVGLAFLELWKVVRTGPKPWRGVVAAVVAGAVAASLWQNWDLVFGRFASDNRVFHWDTGSMGQVVAGFLKSGGRLEGVGIVRVPHWVDTRLPALAAGIPHRDLGLDGEDVKRLLALPGRKLFLVKDDDALTRSMLQGEAPHGLWLRYPTNTPERYFWAFTVPDGGP